jgi:hypothetical protein
MKPTASPRNEFSVFATTVEQRLAALHHVLYEMEMFVDLPIPCEVSVLQNAIAESYLIHARVLCDFFQQERRQPVRGKE